MIMYDEYWKDYKFVSIQIFYRKKVFIHFVEK